jgi:hypothetical protein
MCLVSLQIRRGVLGFELDQISPDMADAAGVAGRQDSRTSMVSGELDDGGTAAEPASQKARVSHHNDCCCCWPVLFIAICAALTPTQEC